MSLSARRAWIEKIRYIMYQHPLCVALRKESVDRKLWVEYQCHKVKVALRKESVDRK